jgi:hypothetical protein
LLVFGKIRKKDLGVGDRKTDSGRYEKAQKTKGRKTSGQKTDPDSKLPNPNT